MHQFFFFHHHHQIEYKSSHRMENYFRLTKKKKRRRRKKVCKFCKWRLCMFRVFFLGWHLNILKTTTTTTTTSNCLVKSFFFILQTMCPNYEYIMLMWCMHAFVCAYCMNNILCEFLFSFILGIDPEISVCVCLTIEYYCPPPIFCMWIFGIEKAETFFFISKAKIQYIHAWCIYSDHYYNIWNDDEKHIQHTQTFKRESKMKLNSKYTHTQLFCILFLSLEFNWIYFLDSLSLSLSLFPCVHSPKSKWQ